jgi:hypothetical protein
MRLAATTVWDYELADTANPSILAIDRLIDKL